ncbi:hypothetical protein M407DRAFT_32067 [Tulasnella calospora MUT 4182]|uniref:Uncharacterized protein n=1 Tax=Tulasnella calospora MUT 4182 TaxID=1051891 RepID=A0A0C3Q4M0_9AGAM|nr:hypothetical protein M407DRAFT_32067 [Tulasnella calospora MUT 4182]
MPAQTDAGQQTPLPATQADAADELPAMNETIPTNYFDGIEMQINDDGQPTIRVKYRGYEAGEDRAMHPTLFSAPPDVDIPVMFSTLPETDVPFQYKEPIPFSPSVSLIELLAQDAQLRNEETLNFSDIEEDFDYDVYGLGDTTLSPGTKDLIDRIEKLEDFNSRSNKDVHLMASRGKKHRHEKRRNAEDTATSSYDRKGKGRELGTCPEETEQIMNNKEFAEREQAKIFEEDSKMLAGKADEAGNLNKENPKRKRGEKKHKSKSHLHLTQWIETPSPSPGARIPAASPVRALKQLPSGGYLAQAWTGDTGNRKKDYRNKVSKHTRRRLEARDAKLKAWREGSDISEHTAGGGGPPDDSSSSSSDLSDESNNSLNSESKSQDTEYTTSSDDRALRNSRRR